MSSPQLKLVLHPTPLSIHRLPPTPENISQTIPLIQPTPTSLSSITITPTELSLILASNTALPPFTDLKSEPNWRAFQVAGTLDFALVGILAYLTAPLKEAGVSVFCVSTYDTDWILVKEDKVDIAKRVWEGVGCVVEELKV